MSRSFRNFIVLAALSPTLLVVSPGCQNSEGAVLELMPASALPADIRSQPIAVQEAYRFAAANPELMQQIPCYCGCGAVGHTSNYSCYIAGADSRGSLEFDRHAVGCSICVDITQDTMRLSRQGKSAIEIRAYVDDTYSRYGTSNIP
jgi:hypothetical protein